MDMENGNGYGYLDRQRDQQRDAAELENQQRDAAAAREDLRTQQKGPARVSLLWVLLGIIAGLFLIVAVIFVGPKLLNRSNSGGTSGTPTAVEVGLETGQQEVAMSQPTSTAEVEVLATKEPTRVPPTWTPTKTDVPATAVATALPTEEAVQHEVVVQPLAPGSQPPSVAAALPVLETIDPESEPWVWEYVETQDHLQGWAQCPYSPEWCRFAGRPGLWVVVDSSATSVKGIGLIEGPNVTVVKIEEDQPQTDIWLTDGQIFTFGLADVSEDEIISYAETLASHTGSSNRQKISIAKAYQ